VAELDELASILQGVEPLKYLEPRLANWKNTGVDASSLLSIYRLVSRGLKDEIERLRGLMQRARAEMEKMAATIRQLRLEPAAPPPPPAEETLAALREQLEARGKELLAAEERYEKLMNDVRNMRARMESDVTRRVEKAREDLVKRLLPVLDSFEWGLRQVRDATDPKAVLAGMESIFKQLREALRQEGLTEIPTEQQIFDPRVHEGMGHVPTHEVPEDWIYDELRKGYFLGDRLLRAAMVRLARRPGPGEEPQPAPWAAAPLEPEPPWPDGPQGRPSSEPADEGGEVPQGQDYDRDLLPGEEGPELGPGDKEPEEVEEREESPPLE
jgi:molecular chaperone GrpE